MSVSERHLLRQFSFGLSQRIVGAPVGFDVDPCDGLTRQMAS